LEEGMHTFFMFFTGAAKKKRRHLREEGETRLDFLQTQKALFALVAEQKGHEIQDIP
jgi:hypothetical protein